MDEKKEKSIKIVKSIKLLESVFKTSHDQAQKSRVKKEMDSLRKMLQDLYPDVNVEQLEDAIFSDSMVLVHEEKDAGLAKYETLKDIEIENISAHKDDEEINLAAGIIKYFEDRIWSATTDQHTKMDFSNAGVRETINRKLDQCDRSLKLFTQTISDMEKSKSGEYVSQLQMMRAKQGRVFLFELTDFFRSAKTFITNLISDAEFGGTMILNSQDPIKYADYDAYKMFEGRSVLDALRYTKKFISEALQVINVPEIKKIEKSR